MEYSNNERNRDWQKYPMLKSLVYSKHKISTWFSCCIHLWSRWIRCLRLWISGVLSTRGNEIFLPTWCPCLSIQISFINIHGYPGEGSRGSGTPLLGYENEYYLKRQNVSEPPFRNSARRDFCLWRRTKENQFENASHAISQLVSNTVGWKAWGTWSFLCVFAIYTKSARSYSMSNERLFADRFGETAWNWDTDSKIKANNELHAVSNFEFRLQR